MIFNLSVRRALLPENGEIEVGGREVLEEWADHPATGLRPVIAAVLARCIPDLRQILGGGTALADGTIAPTWEWATLPDLFSGKADYPGMNLQIAATLGGRVAAIGPDPVHGARHDAHAFAASGLKALLVGLPAAADLGCPAALMAAKMRRRCGSSSKPR